MDNNNYNNTQYSGYNSMPNENYNNMQNVNYYQNSYGANDSIVNNNIQKKGGFVSASMVLGLLSSVLMIGGMVAPAMDFRIFHQEIDLQYNLLKICKNLELASSMWGAIPVGFVIAIVAMIALSFIDLPILKILPVVLASAMFVIMLADMNNVISWCQELTDKFFDEGEIVIDIQKVFQSLMWGLYTLVAGVVVGLVSCFVKGRNNGR